MVRTIESGAPAERPAVGGRLRFVDGLRGVAALYVVLFHLTFHDTSPVHPVLSRMPPAAWAFVSHGYLGVEIFFVLSGFVIARSLRRDAVTAGLLARFAARRSLRLDPPYWTVLAVTVGLKWGLHRANPHETWFAGHGFTAGDVLANFGYVHTLLGHPVVLGVSWTLCLELMFYLSYAVLLGVAWRVGRGNPPAAATLLAVFGPAFLASVWCFHGLLFMRVGDGHSGLHAYVSFGHLFLLGAVLQWATDGRVPAGWFVAAALVTAGMTAYDSLVRHAVEWTGIVGVATAGLMFAAAKLDRWDRWLTGPVLQTVGRTSYSVYLVHVPVCTVVLSAAVKVFGMTVRGTVVGLPAAAVATALATVALHRLVEAPSLRLSHRVRMRPGVPSAGGRPATIATVAA